MVMSDSLEEVILWKVVWSYAMIRCGGPFVAIILDFRKPLLYAGSYKIAVLMVGSHMKVNMMEILKYEV